MTMFTGNKLVMSLYVEKCTMTWIRTYSCERSLMNASMNRGWNVEGRKYDA